MTQQTKNILVVDDDRAILEAICLTLESFGFDVDSTTNGTEIHQKLILNKPDLIVMDVLLSGIDGREITKELRHQDSFKDIPIVMISAHPNVSKTALEAGANIFLEKPFDIDKLLGAVEKCLNC